MHMLNTIMQGMTLHKLEEHMCALRATYVRSHSRSQECVEAFASSAHSPSHKQHSQSLFCRGCNSDGAKSSMVDLDVFLPRASTLHPHVLLCGLQHSACSRNNEARSLNRPIIIHDHRVLCARTTFLKSTAASRISHSTLLQPLISRLASYAFQRTNCTLYAMAALRRTLLANAVLICPSIAVEGRYLPKLIILLIRVQLHGIGTCPTLCARALFVSTSVPSRQSPITEATAFSNASHCVRCVRSALSSQPHGRSNEARRTEGSCAKAPRRCDESIARPPSTPNPTNPSTAL